MKDETTQGRRYENLFLDGGDPMDDDEKKRRRMVEVKKMRSGGFRFIEHVMIDFLTKLPAS